MPLESQSFARTRDSLSQDRSLTQSRRDAKNEKNGGGSAVSTALANVKGKLNPLKKADPRDVLKRVLNEESTKDIAQSFGVTRSALNQWLLETAETQWRAVQVARAYKRKEEAEDEMDTATDSLSLARARERLKAAQWDLERVCRRIYGSDVPADLAERISIQLNIGGVGATNAVQHDVEGTVLASTTSKP
jgi:hypothetical protein